MKHRFWYSAALITGGLIFPAGGNVIYSSILDTAIPTTFTGVTLTIDGGTVNPFFGGVGVANNDLFQPVRSGTGNLDPIVNFGVGSTIDVNAFFSTGFGGSDSHLGSGTTSFVSGQEGYLGFKLNDTNYGWMRVVFTGNTSGAVIKDWAYDSSGAAIVTGRVEQSAAFEGEQSVTLSPGAGESFTLGSLITDTDGNTNHVVKTGAGTTVLSATNTYTGVTSIQAGVLSINGNQSAATGDVTVTGAGTLLTGIGTIGGDTTIGAGAVHSAGGVGDNKVGIQTFDQAGESNTNLTYSSGSIFEWDINGNSNLSNFRGAAEGYDGVDGSGVLSVSEGSIFRVVLGSGVDLANNPFWNAPFATHTWSDIFSGFSGLAGGFTTSNLQVVGQDISGVGSFSINGTSLTWSAVPEPTSALAGLLLAAGLLRRSRRGV